MRPGYRIPPGPCPPPSHRPGAAPRPPPLRCTHLSGGGQAPAPARWPHPRAPREVARRPLPPDYVSVGVSGRQGLGCVPGDEDDKGEEPKLSHQDGAGRRGHRVPSAPRHKSTPTRAASPHWPGRSLSQTTKCVPFLNAANSGLNQTRKELGEVNSTL